jgi:predicted Zn-dependent protease
VSQLEVAGQVLDLVRELTGRGSEAEVSVDRREVALTRFADSHIHQNVAHVEASVRLRLHVGGRTAAGSTTVTSADALRLLVERTVAASALCPVDNAWPGLTPAESAVVSGNYDTATATAAPDERAARVRAFVDAAGGLSTAGYCRTSSWHGAFANSAGRAVAGAFSEASIDAIARAAGADGVARLASVRLADLDGAVPIELPPGDYPVVLEPTAVADVLSSLAVWGFNGKIFNERRSFARLGESQFDPALSLADDPVGADRVGHPYDAEGTPKRRLGLVAAGVTSAVTHDRRSAAVARAHSTGHALAGTASWGPFAVNPVLEAASGTAEVTEVDGPAADSAVLALVSGVDRGLLVTDHWYTRVLDPRTLVMTGLTRNGVWLIEDGAVTRPVRNMRFTQSYPLALAPGAVRQIGAHAPTLPSSAGFTVTAPALHLAAWHYTGGASG